MDDLRLRLSRLTGVPILDRGIQSWLQGCLELVALRCFLELMPPIFIAKAQEPRGFRLQRFGNSDCRPLIRSCTQLLLRIGRRAMISLPAAMMMAMIAAVVGSMNLMR